MGTSCFGPKRVPYVSEGNIIKVNIRADTENYQKQIRIPDANTLRKAIIIYQEQISKENLYIKKAVIENDLTELPLDTPLNEINIDFNRVIIVTLK